MCHFLFHFYHIISFFTPNSYKTSTVLHFYLHKIHPLPPFLKANSAQRLCLWVSPES